MQSDILRSDLRAQPRYPCVRRPSNTLDGALCRGVPGQKMCFDSLLGVCRFVMLMRGFCVRFAVVVCDNRPPPDFCGKLSECLFSTCCLPTSPVTVALCMLIACPELTPSSTSGVLKAGHRRKGEIIGIGFIRAVMRATQGKERRGLDWAQWHYKEAAVIPQLPAQWRIALPLAVQCPGLIENGCVLVCKA